MPQTPADAQGNWLTSTCVKCTTSSQTHSSRAYKWVDGDASFASSMLTTAQWRSL